MVSEHREPAVSVTRPSSRKFWIPPCALAVFILILSSTPGTYFPKHPDLINNMVHLAEFGLLSVLLARALHHSGSFSGPGLFLWTTFVCVTFGALDEAHQFLVPQRMFDLMDLFFDSLGSAAGSVSYVLLKNVNTESMESKTFTTGEIDD